MSSTYKDEQSSSGSSDSTTSSPSSSIKEKNGMDTSKANGNNSSVPAIATANTASLHRGSNLDVGDAAKIGGSASMKRSSSNSGSASSTIKKQPITTTTTTIDVIGELKDGVNGHGSPNGNASTKNTSATKKILKKQSSSSSPKNNDAIKSDDVDIVGQEESERTTPLLAGKKLSMSSSSIATKREKKMDDATNNKKSKKKESEKSEPAAVVVYNNDNDNDDESMAQDVMDEGNGDADGNEMKKDIEPETTATLIKGVVKTVITTIPLLLKLLMFFIWAIIVFLMGMMKGKEGRMASIARIKEGMNTFLRNSQETAMSLMKRVLITLWFVAVIFAILSLLGIQPKKYIFGKRQADIVIEQTDIEVKDTSNDLDEASLKMVVNDSKKKVTKKDEVLFACEEVQCNAKCMTKASPKCSKSDNCMKERAKICKKRCRRARCEARCKDEPQLGYVEREMKIEKCKESCQSEKCKTKCDEEFQSCKSKCFSKAHKFVCPEIPGETAGAGSATSDSKSTSGDEGSDSNLDFSEGDDSSLDFGASSSSATASSDDFGDSSSGSGNVDFTIDDTALAGGGSDDEPL